MFSQLYEQLKADDIFKPKSEEEVAQDILIQLKATKNEDGSYDIEGDVGLTNSNLTKISIKFRYVSGDFYCSWNNLTSLEGAPKLVGGSFYCRGNKLTTLEGAPEKVGGDFYCSSNKLISLKGIGEVRGRIVCDSNPVSEKELLATIGR